MKRFRPFRSSKGPWLIGLAAFVLAGWTARGQYDPGWARYFRVGGLVGLNVKADFTASGSLSLNVRHPAGVYDDGYVRMDRTGDQTLTTYWGYDANPGQYDSAANTLTLHDTTGFTTSGSDRTSADENPVVGLDLGYGGNLWYWGRARIGWELGFGLLPINVRGQQELAGTAGQSAFTFDTTGVILPPGAYSGPPDGSGTVSIPLTPISTNSVTAPATVNETDTLDATLYVIRLGPSVYFDFNPRLGLSLGAGPAVGILSGDLEFTQTAVGTSARSHGSVGGTDIVFGGYVDATLMYHAVKNGDIYLGVQYIPLGNASISGRGREARLKLGGAAFVSAGINWPF